MTSSYEVASANPDILVPGDFVDVMEHKFQFSLPEDVRKQHVIVRSFLIRAGLESYKEWQQQRHTDIIGEFSQVSKPFTDLPTGFSGRISEEVKDDVSIFSVIVYTDDQKVVRKFLNVIRQLTGVDAIYAFAHRKVSPAVLKRFSVKKAPGTKTDNSGGVTASVSVISEIEATPQRSVTVYVRKEDLHFTVDLPDHISSISGLVRALHSQHNVQVPEQRIVLTKGTNGEPVVISSVPVGDCKISILSMDEFNRFREALVLADRIQREKRVALDKTDDLKRVADETRRRAKCKAEEMIRKAEEMRLEAERKAEEMIRKAEEMRLEAERKAEENMVQVNKDLRW